MSDDVRHASDAETTSVVGARDRVRGDLHVGGGLRVDGIVRGHISPNGDDASLVLSRHAGIDGDVHVRRARIEGQVKGTLQIEGHLDVTGTAVIEGDIRYRSMAIEAGASITGHLTALDVET